MTSITKHTIGSNGHKLQYANLRALVFITLFTLSLMIVAIIRYSNNNFVIAYVSSHDKHIVYANESTPKSDPTPTTAIPTPSQTELVEIVAYIAQVFEPEGKHVVVWAIKCFYSESGLRIEAVNGSNSNGTIDRGIAQVNSVHNYSPEELHTLEGNIDAAYEVYQKQGMGAWHGKACN